MSAPPSWTTPGPWRVQQLRPDEIAVVAPDGLPIASGFRSASDAQLVASALALYAALAVLVASIDRLGQVETPNMRAARAALALAEGR